MSKEEQAAVTAYVKREYDRVVFQQPNSYLSKNAQSDPEAWQSRLRELIAGDERRVVAIVEAYARTPDGGQSGFTLIELSIVLVIIGLIVGGVLVGQNLVSAAAVRAQISQIEKYNTAANTFYGKYGYLPGDIKDPDASNFGLVARGQYPGQGDGNGIMESNWGNNATDHLGNVEGSGEVLLFWTDLSTLHLIDGTFLTASAIYNQSETTPAQLNLVLPQAKVAQNNYLYVWSANSKNYFGLSAVKAISSDICGSCVTNKAGLTVKQAQDIDSKIDDGLPQTGNVTAQWINGYAAGFLGASSTTATAGTNATCYDNSNVAGQPQQYSVEISNGSNVNCALSFRFQ